MNLAELIYERKGSDSYSTLAARAKGQISAGRLQQLATGPLKDFPELATMDAIADALGVSFDAVLFAVAESFGRTVGRYGSRFAQMLPPRVDELSQNAQEAIIETTRAMVGMLPETPTPAQVASAHIRKSAAAVVARTGRT